MKKPFIIILSIVIMTLTGCRPNGEGPLINIDGPLSDFQPVSVHLKPSFTRIIRPDRANQVPGAIGVYVVLQDQFGDPIKSLGQFRFEVYKYKSGAADSLGTRFPDGLMNIDLSRIDTNQKHWDRTLANYHFTLTLPDIPPTQRKIVLQATFTDLSGKRFEDFLALEYQK